MEKALLSIEAERQRKDIEEAEILKRKEEKEEASKLFSNKEMLQVQ